MNGTLFATNVIPVDRTALIPASGEVIDGTWCRKVANQEIRAMGWASGTMIPTTFNIWHQVLPLELSATISLPDNAFGTLRPPMIYVMPRFGSVVVYKQVQDSNHSLSIPISGNPNNPLFRTWVHDLHKDDIAVGGVAGFRWSFTVRHISFGVLPDFKYPYTDMKNGWYPSYWNMGYMGEALTTNKFNVILYWYALGVNTSL